MAKANPSTITLKSGGGDVLNTREAKVAAGQTITPGMVIELNAAGDALIPGTAGLNNTKFAIEKQLVGAGGISDNYAAGERMFYRRFQPGDEVYAFLGFGQNVSAGALLQTNTSGHLIAVGAGVAVAQALESKVTTAAARIKVAVV